MLIGLELSRRLLRNTATDFPPSMAQITYVLVIDAAVDDRQLEPMHYNVRKYGTIFYTVAAATKLEGSITRKSATDL